MAIGNELGLTYELFTQLEQMAREKLEEKRQVNQIKKLISNKNLFLGGRCSK